MREQIPNSRETKTHRDIEKKRTLLQRNDYFCLFCFLHRGFYKVDSNLPPLKMFIRHEEKKIFLF